MDVFGVVFGVKGHILGRVGRVMMRGLFVRRIDVFNLVKYGLVGRLVKISDLFGFNGLLTHIRGCLLRLGIRRVRLRGG